MSIAILSRPVLVLNANWQAIDEKSTQRAIEDMTSGGWVLSSAGKKVWSYAFYGMDISLDEAGKLVDARATDWDEWIHLPIREKDGVIQAGRMAIRAPTVIITKKFSKPSGFRDVAFSKKNIKKRDKFQCQYCKKFFPEEELNIDHVKPRYHGGADDWENTVASCIPCNSKKGHKSNEEMGYALEDDPKAPKRIYNILAIKHPTWRPFLET